MWHLIKKITMTISIYEGVFKSFWTGHLEQELQMVQLSATKCSRITILWVSLMSFATITLCVASWYVFVVTLLSTQIGNFWIHPSVFTYGIFGIFMSVLWKFRICMFHSNQIKKMVKIRTKPKIKNNFFHHWVLKCYTYTAIMLQCYKDNNSCKQL
jgi:hypothetical protein